MISFIIPTYNNAAILERQLPGLMNFFTENKLETEVIIVDDGSDDPGVAQRVAETNACRFLHHEKNKGKGATVRTGMLAAKGKYRIFTDADIPFSYEDIRRMVYYLEFKEYDIVVGDRTLEDSSYFSEISTSRRMGSGAFTFFVGRFVTTGLFDTQCGLKGFSAAVAEDIFSVSRVNGFAFDVEVLYIALKRNYDIKRIPVTLRNQEGSTVNLYAHAVGMAMDVLRLKWNHVRGFYNKR